MVALFTLEEMAAFLQRDLDELLAATCQLAHDLTLEAFQVEVGAGVITDPPQPGLKALALQVASRVVLNPAAARNETVGPVSVSYSAFGVQLTDAERADLRIAVGFLTPAGASPVGTIPLAAGLAYPTLEAATSDSYSPYGGGWGSWWW